MYVVVTTAEDGTVEVFGAWRSEDRAADWALDFQANSYGEAVVHQVCGKA
jgi:hypothetical protein